jgi:hypothetical protein
MKSIIPAAQLVLLLAITSGVCADTRFDEFTKKNASPTEPVRVLSAGLLGGSGTERLTGGGFQPDGTIVLAASDVGLKSLPANALVDVRFGLTAYPPQALQPARAKK